MLELPSKGKRVLMITPDVLIDRRILIEAETLVAEGYEVYLLAGWDPGQADLFEVQGKVRIERIKYEGADPRLLMFYKAHGKAIGLLNGVCSTLNKMGKFAAMAVAPIFHRFVRKARGASKGTEVLEGEVRNCGTETADCTQAPCSAPGSTGGSLEGQSLRQSLVLPQSVPLQPLLVFPMKLVGFIINRTARFFNHLIKWLATGVARVSGLTGYEYAFYRRAVFYRPDMIHVHDLPMLCIGARIKKDLGIPLIYDMHEFYPEQETLTRLQRLRLRRRERKFIRQCDRLITVNPLLAQEISKSYGNLKINVIQNATVLPQDFNHAEYDLFREEYDIKKSDIIVLYQGWISEHRNLQNLVAGLAQVSQPIKLVIMGYGEFAVDLARIAEKTGVTDKIVFVPSKSQEELLYYTASADLGIIPYPLKLDPNTKYSSPNKLYEFIAARLPILCNTLPFVKSVVEDNQFGLAFDMASPQSFAHALNAFPYDRLEFFRHNLAVRGVRYLWEAEAPKLLEIYRSLETA